MRVFVTGGTGTIGTPVVTELISHGHTVLALARSDSSAHALHSAGATMRTVLSRKHQEPMSLTCKVCSASSATNFPTTAITDLLQPTRCVSFKRTADSWSTASSAR